MAAKAFFGLFRPLKCRFATATSTWTTSSIRWTSTISTARSKQVPAAPSSTSTVPWSSMLSDTGFLVTSILETDPGDADLNGLVTASGDGAVLLSNLGAPGPFGWADGNFTGHEDSLVTASADGAILLENLSGDTTAIPEPGSFVLVVVFSSWALFRQRPATIRTTCLRRPLSTWFYLLAKTSARVPARLLVIPDPPPLQEGPGRSFAECAFDRTLNCVC